MKRVHQKRMYSYTNRICQIWHIDFTERNSDVTWTLITEVLSNMYINRPLSGESAAVRRIPLTKANNAGMFPCHDVAIPWNRRHQMETFSALLSLCEGNPPVTGGFPPQRPVTRSFDVFFDLRLNKRLSKKSRHRWFETPWLLLWRHCYMCADWMGYFETFHQRRRHDQMILLWRYHKRQIQREQIIICILIYKKYHAEESNTGIILGIGSVNETRRHNVMSPLIGWSQSKNKAPFYDINTEKSCKRGPPASAWFPSQTTRNTERLQWRHNGRDGVSKHQPHFCLLKRLFRRRSKNTSKLRVTGLCVGNPHNGSHVITSYCMGYISCGRHMMLNDRSCACVGEFDLALADHVASHCQTCELGIDASHAPLFRTESGDLIYNHGLFLFWSKSVCDVIVDNGSLCFENVLVMITVDNGSLCFENVLVMITEQWRFRWLNI